MAKAAVKKTTERKAPVKKMPVDPGDQIEKICYQVLDKLKALNLDTQLQSDVEWCLGSYSADKNPVGLYETAERAVTLFKDELSKKRKGVTAKFVGDIEKALKNK